jgi:hypothetical protein
MGQNCRNAINAMGQTELQKCEKGKNAKVQWVRHAEMQTGSQKRRIN